MLCMMGRLGNLSSTKEFSLAPTDKHQLLCTKALTKVKKCQIFFSVSSYKLFIQKSGSLKNRKANQNTWLES